MPGLLVLLAHPDDEFFCAGLLAALTRKAVPVHLVYWTRGEGGGSPRHRLFWKGFPRAWHPRLRELRRSASILKVASVSFLDSIDPVPTSGLRAPTDSVETVLQRLAPVLARCRPELLLTHGSAGDYGHPAHRQLHEIARRLASGPGSSPLLSFNATSPLAPAAKFLNAADSADFLLDCHPYLEIKRNILRAYRSQKGALESLSPAGDAGSLLQVSSWEGYHAWTDKAVALGKLRSWTGLAGGPLTLV